jgi:MYXO-CTERM domain-containing protein
VPAADGGTPQPVAQECETIVEAVKSCVLVQTACKVSADCPVNLTCVIAPSPGTACAQPSDDGGKPLPCRDAAPPAATPDSGFCQPAYGGSYEVTRDAEAGSASAPNSATTPTKSEPPVAPDPATAQGPTGSGGSGASYASGDSDESHTNPVAPADTKKCSVSAVGTQTPGYSALFGVLGVALTLGVRRRRSR